MKIVGFAQLYNELEKGNLHNWFRCMSVCDAVFIFDQASTDGSDDVYKKQGTHVVYSETNRFQEEIVCKSILLKKLLKEIPDVDWIIWMDGDTLLDKRLLDRTNLESFLNSKSEFDGLVLGHYNLWRSYSHYRVDSLFHWLHENGVLAIWKNNGQLNFPENQGLHLNQFPSGIINKTRVAL